MCIYCNWCGPLFKQNCKQSQNSESNPDTLINGNPCCMKVHLQSHAPVFVFSSTHKIVSQDEQQRFGKERPRSCKSKDPVSANTVAPQKWLQGSMIPTCPLPGFPEPWCLSVQALFQRVARPWQLVDESLVEENWIIITLVKNYVLFEWDSVCIRSHLSLSLVLALSLSVDASSHSL